MLHEYSFIGHMINPHPTAEGESSPGEFLTRESDPLWNQFREQLHHGDLPIWTPQERNQVVQDLLEEAKRDKLTEKERMACALSFILHRK